MENDKYVSLGDGYIDIDGGAKEVTQLLDGVLDGKKRW